MNEFEKKKCLELTNKMHKMDLCRPFKDKVDPIRDGAPDYFQIVKRPMDLTTIRRKLNSNDYKSIDTWAADVNQVWTNAKLYNNEGTLIYVMAQEMEIWFGRKFESMPRNKDEEWMEMLRKSTKKLFDLSRHPPSSIVAARPLISLAAALQAEISSSASVALSAAPNTDQKPEIDQKSQPETAKDLNSSTITLQQPAASILKNKNEKIDKNDDKNSSEGVSNQESPQGSESPASRPPSTPPQLSSSPPLSPQPKPNNSKSQQSADPEKQEENVQDSKTQETSENEEEVGDL
ncbi:hypothetical protein M9Y10_038636 [Tritrichomonas musculus]|uniref:Bromo domain-containing protein n=1 Tax=Tritrichomonas musculus TaxID=1915356 RepID=A0ABR2K9Z1_9EUKA